MNRIFKKILSVLLSASIIAAVFAGCAKVDEFTFCPANEKESDVAVVSFNVAAPWGSLLKNTSTGARVKRFAAYMNAVKPDSIGTQEMNSDWMKKLAELMPDYDSYGVVRGGDDNEKKSEMNSVFWLKDKYDCIAQNTFWLSETPDKESKFEGAGCYRVCSYVVLQSKETDLKYIHMNTHLDNASDEARVYGANVLLSKIDELKAQYPNTPIVLSGDFNDYINGPASGVLADKLNVQSADTNTYHDWGKITEGEPIDFIFTTGTIGDYQILNDTTNGLVSDHYGIYQTIKF